MSERAGPASSAPPRMAIRALLVLVCAVFTTLATLGFACESTLSDESGFVSGMDRSLRTAEVRLELLREIQTAIHEARPKGGGTGGLSASERAELYNAAMAGLYSPAFEDAWRSWSANLYRGLVAAAEGENTSYVRVNERIATVTIGPLLDPLTADPRGAEIAKKIQLPPTFSTDTGGDLEWRLHAVGLLAGLRWWLLLAAFSPGLGTVFEGGYRLQWLATCLSGAALGTGLLTLAVVLMRSVQDVTAQMPALSRGVASALTDSWPLPIALVSVALGIAAVILDRVAWLQLSAKDRR